MADIKTHTRPFDVATQILAPEEAAAYRSAALEESDPAAFSRAFGDVARARSMASIADASGLGRGSLYTALSQTGNPSLDTVQRVIAALGLTLAVVPSRQATGSDRG